MRIHACVNFFSTFRPLPLSWVFKLTSVVWPSSFYYFLLVLPCLVLLCLGLWQMAVMEEMSAVWREVDHPSGASLQECFDVQVGVCYVSCACVLRWLAAAPAAAAVFAGSGAPSAAGFLPYTIFFCACVAAGAVVGGGGAGAGGAAAAPAIFIFACVSYPLAYFQVQHTANYSLVFLSLDVNLKPLMLFSRVKTLLSSFFLCPGTYTAYAVSLLFQS